MIMIKMGKKDRIELIVTIILVFFFIVLLIAFSHRGKGQKQISKHILPRMFSVREYFRYDTQRNQGTPFILDKAHGEITEIKRDPFSFGLSGETNVIRTSDLLLKGIIWDSDNPSAVINDQVLKEGVTIGGFKVVKILRESVILENGASRLELKLNQ